MSENQNKAGSQVSTLRDKNPERIELCLRLSGRTVQAVEAFDNHPGERDWRVREVDVHQDHGLA